MPRKNQEQPDVPPFEYRAGVTIPPIGGMFRRGDPSQIPIHRLHLGVNIRLADNEAGSRPGLTHVEGTAEDACITGIFEIDDFAVAIYITQLAKALLDTAGVPDPGTPFQIMAFNEEKEPPELNYWDANATFAKSIPSPWRVTGAGDAFNTFQRMNGMLLILNGDKIYQAEFSEDDAVPRLDLSHLVTLPESSGTIVSSCIRRERVDDLQTGEEYEKDVLYLGGDGGRVWRWDGTTLELVKTLANGGRMQVIEWRGVGVVAAGDNAGGFTYQEQKGYAWVDVAWPQDFECNGLCEFYGDVIFVGGFETGPTSDCLAFYWTGAGGTPTLFATDTQPTLRMRYRTPLVVGGALHFLKVVDENGVQNGVFIARFVDTHTPTGDDEWADLDAGDKTEPGFFIAYAGAMLMLVPYEGPSGFWPSGDNIVIVVSGDTPNFNPVYNWPLINGTDHQLQPGQGFEAIAL